MSWPFIILLSLYGLYTLWANRHPEKNENPATHPPPSGMILLQTPLFLFAFYLAWQYGAFSRDLVSPLSIAMGLVLGHLIFALSLLATHRVCRDVLTHFIDLKSTGWFLKENPGLILRFFGVAMTEEIIYRAAAQPLMSDLFSSAPLAIGLTAMLFSIVHKHFFQNTLLASLEFLVFALLLGALYYWTNSLILVVIIHALRNLESVYLEYLQKLDELGDETQALRTIEERYSWRPKKPQATEQL